jgi:hypothetical protein
VSPITPRAVVIGAVLAGVIAAINPITAFESGTWNAGVGSLLVGALFPLFLLVALNGALIRWVPRWAFARGELLVIYGMLTVSVGFLIWGGLPFLLSTTVFPFYMATPGNDWEHRVWQHIPDWLRVSSLDAVNWYWEGAPEGARLPYGAWLGPLLAWGSFTLALMTAMFCLAALLRRDWIERQRLTFPLVDVPLAITGSAARPSLGTSFLNNRVFWLGAMIPATLSVTGWLHLLIPSVPAANLWAIPVGSYFSGMGMPWNVLSDARVTILFPVIGVICLLPGEVALSLWLFYFIYQAQMLLWASFGIAEGGSSPVAINPRLFASFEEAGAFIALTGFVVYQSRGAMRGAWLRLVGRGPEESDPCSPVSGRWAVVGFICANLFLVGFAVHMGAKWWAFLAMIGVYYAVVVGASRLVAAAGVMSTDTGFYPRWVVVRALGSVPLGEPTLVLFAYLSSIYTFEPDNLPMPQMMNSFKLLHAGRLRSAWFPLAAAIAMVLVLAVGAPALLRVVYQHGANSLGVWPFTSDSRWAFNEMDHSLRNPDPPDNWLRLAMVIGAVIMVGLTLLHTRFVWWPVSPVGFLIGSSWGTNYKLWTNALIAWSISSAIRRYGGLRLYRACRPAFLGLILGQYFSDGLLAILSAIFGMRRPM